MGGHQQKTPVVLNWLFQIRDKDTILVMQPIHRIVAFSLLIVLFSLSPLLSVTEYNSQDSANFIYATQGNNYVAMLCGTVNLDSLSEVYKLTLSGSPVSTTGVRFFYRYGDTLQEDSITGFLYMTYYKTNGQNIEVMLSPQTTYSFKQLDRSRPISLYLLVQYNQYYNFLNNFVWSSYQLVGVGIDAKFNLLTSNNQPVSILSNQGDTILPTPFLGGGNPGPVGVNSLSIGDPGLGFLEYFYNIADKPIYRLEFAENFVDIGEIHEAVQNSIPLTSLNLYVDNYQKTYLGQSNIAVRFFQSGQTSFSFANVDDYTKTIPYLLYVRGDLVPYNYPFNPWQAPLTATNTAQVALQVLQADLNEAIEGEYVATITVEIISGE